MRFRFLLVLAGLAAYAVAVGVGGRAAAVDPRAGGLEVAMGEWAVVSEASAIRPGRVTFAVRNRGRLAHGFRIRGEGGGRDRLEARTRVLQPGETAQLTIDLPAGRYTLECFVEDTRGDHDDLGMRALLTVSGDAPLVAARATGAGDPPLVRIEGFAFRPSVLRVRRGVTVRWVNGDATTHTVTAASGAFSSRQLGRGGTFVRRFTRPGSFAYLCAIHPQMRARLIVR